jgi:hypothetical protein
MACFQVALVSVEQAEILLGYFFVNLWAVNDLIKHLKEFETSEEGGVVFETLGYHRRDALVDVFHLALERAEVLAELFASHFVLDVHDVLVLVVVVRALVFEHVVGEGLESLVEHGVDVFDVLGELVALSASDGDFLEHCVVHGGVDDVFEVSAALDEAVEFFEKRGMDDIPTAVRAVLVVFVDEFEAPAGFSYLFKAA